MLLTFDDIYGIMAFMIKRQENKRVKNTLEKSQNYSRMPLTNDDNYIIMANMTNNKQVTKRGVEMGFTMVDVLQTVVRDGEWQTDVIARFDNLLDALDCLRRHHNGNPTTRIRFQ